MHGVQTFFELSLSFPLSMHVPMVCCMPKTSSALSTVWQAYCCPGKFYFNEHGFSSFGHLTLNIFALIWETVAYLTFFISIIKQIFLSKTH